MSASPTQWVKSQPKWTWIVWLCVLAGHLVFFNATWFSIDQTRDVFQASDIASGSQFPLNGPLMHWIAHIGPFYYYFLAIAFLVYSHPYSAYFLLAIVSSLTVAGCYYFAKNYFGSRTGALFVALYAPSAFALIDSRALWTPGFLPFWNLLAFYSLAILCWDKRDRGLIALAVVLGLATQFHLSFVLVLPACFFAFLLARTRIRVQTLLWSLAAGLATQAPYLTYQMTHDWVDIRAFLAFARTGDATPAASALPFLERFFNFLIIPAYLAENWLHVPGPWLQLFQFSSYLFSGFLVAALLFLPIQAVKLWKRKCPLGQKYAVILFWFGSILFVLLWRNSDLYYYYFDLLIPLPFLLVAIFADRLLGAIPEWLPRRPIVVLGVFLLSFYIAIQSAAVFDWLSTMNQEGMMQLTISQVDLHQFQTVSSRREDTFITLRYKVEIAWTLAREYGWSRDEAYEKVFGSRFYDATDDRGYWLDRFDDVPVENVKSDPVVLWHRSDPLERWTAELGIEVKHVGPFRLGSLPREGAPLEWKMQDGPTVRMPVRTNPDVRTYSFVRAHRWPAAGVHLRSKLTLKSRPRRYLLVIVIRGDQVSPALRVNSERCDPAAANRTLATREFFYELEGVLEEGDTTFELILEGGQDFDLDVFGWAKR